MIQTPTYLDHLKIGYLIHICIKPKVNGNFLFSVKLYLGDVHSYYYICQNLVKLFFDNWQHYFSIHDTKLMRRKNGSVYIDTITDSILNDFKDLKFNLYKSRYRNRSNTIELKKNGSRIKEIDDILYQLFKFDAQAQQTIETKDLFEKSNYI